MLTAGSDQRRQSSCFSAVEIEARFSERLTSRELSTDYAASEDDKAEPTRQTGVASIEKSITDGRSKELQLQRDDVDLYIKSERSELSKAVSGKC